MGLADRVLIEAVEQGARTSAGQAVISASERFAEETFATINIKLVSARTPKESVTKALGDGLSRQGEILHTLGSDSTSQSLLTSLSRTLGDSSEYSIKGFKYGGSLQQRIENLRQGIVPVDYKSILPKDSRVVLFGETHPVAESREELIDHMGQFKQMGFTHLAMEALTSKRQPLLDAYIAGSNGNATRDAVLKALKKDWGWDTPGYVNLIDEAKSNGIGVLAVDKRIPKAVNEAWNKAGKYGEDSRVREEQWAQIVGDKLDAEPGSRVFMLAGKAHVGIDPTQERYLTSLLNKRELNPFVVDLDAPVHTVGGGTVYTQAVRGAGLDSQRFAVPIVQSGFRPSDFIVNIPARPGSSTFTDPMMEMLRIMKSMTDDLVRQEESIPWRTYPRSTYSQGREFGLAETPKSSFDNYRPFLRDYRSSFDNLDPSSHGLLKIKVDEIVARTIKHLP